MTVYEVKKFTKEISYKDRKNIRTGCCFDDLCPETIQKVYDREEAMDILKKYTPECNEYSGNAGKYYLVEEYGIEIYEENEDGMFLSGSDYTYSYEYEWNEDSGDIKKK